MPFALILALLLGSLKLSATSDSWYGFCVVENNRTRICSQYQPYLEDFSPICNAFAAAENARRWRAHFFSNVAQLKSALADYCDVVRDGDSGAMFACQVATFCPGDTEHKLISLASRVYSGDEHGAQIACFDKEESIYERYFLTQSHNSCFARVEVERLQH